MAVAVVDGALVVVDKNLVGLVDLLEADLGVGRLVHVGVVLLRQLAK